MVTLSNTIANSLNIKDSIKTPSVYRSDVDGLRAIAVMGVILFHFGLGFPGGYLGVDVFFVISGYLISGVLYRCRDRGFSSLGNFYARRARRILPAASLVTLTTLAVGYAYLIPADFVELSESAIACSTFLANVYFWLTSGYFATDAESRPLLHFWSLAVEEQFYLVFPVFFMYFASKLSAKRLFLLTTAFTIVFLAISECMTWRNPSAAFYLLPARSWELLAGVCLFTHEISKGKTQTKHASWKLALGGLALVVCFWMFDKNSHFPGLGSVPIVIATLLLISSGNENSSLARPILGNFVFVAVGKLSYSLYLWHWPAFVFLNYVTFGNPSVPLQIAALVGIFFVSWVSYHFIESPCRFARLSIRNSIAAGLGMQALIVAVAAGIYFNEGIAARMPERVQLLTEEAFRKPSPASDVLLNDGQIADPETRPSTLIWGDSHVEALSPAIAATCQRNGAVCIQSVRNGHCPLVNAWRVGKYDSHQKWQASTLQKLEQFDIQSVILVSRWSVNILGRQNGELDTLITDKRQSLLNANSIAVDAPRVFEESVRATLSLLTQRCENVAIVLQVPEFSEDVPRKAASQLLLGRQEVTIQISLEEHLDRQRLANMIIRRVAAEFGSKVRVFDPVKFFLSSDRKNIYGNDGDQLYFRDKHHLAVLGAEKLCPIIVEIFEWFKIKSHASEVVPSGAE